MFPRLSGDPATVVTTPLASILPDAVEMDERALGARCGTARLDVTVLDRVRLAFGAQFAVLARLGDCLEGHEVLVGHDLGSDKSASQVRVDRASGVD